MTVEDITVEELFGAVAFDSRRMGYDIFWTPAMPASEEEAYRLRAEADPGRGFLNISNSTLRDRDGNGLYFSFPLGRIMRTAKRFDDDGRRDGFLVAVRAKRRLTNALLICSMQGRASFQLGLFGRRFDFLSEAKVREWENAHGESWLTEE